MKLQTIKVKDIDYSVGDKIVFNHIVSFDNEFNGVIRAIQTRKNSQYPILTVEYRIGNILQKQNIKSYMVIRKGNNGKGIDAYYN